jgi:Zn-dependent peptidase ImmA (M78 family)
MFLGPNYVDVIRVSAAAENLRLNLGLSHNKSFPVIDVLEFDIQRVYAEFILIIRADEQFGEKTLAFTKTAPPQIIVRNEIYCRAALGNSFARYVLAHELGHICLSHKKEREHVLTWGNAVSNNLEWEADEFAAEILMPSRAIKNMTLPEITSRFKVSPAFAWQRLNVIKNRTNLWRANKRLKEPFWANSHVELARRKPEYKGLDHALEQLMKYRASLPNKPQTLFGFGNCEVVTEGHAQFARVGGRSAPQCPRGGLESSSSSPALAASFRTRMIAAFSSPP